MPFSYKATHLPDEMSLVKFRRVMGYSSTCASSSVIEGRLYVTLQKRAYDKTLIEPLLESGTLPEFLKDMSVDYAKKRFEGRTSKIEHGMFDVTDGKREAVEQFTNFINCMTTNDMFKQLTLTVKTATSPLTSKVKFYMHAFQRAMLHDTVRALIKRCDLDEFAELILSFLKCNLGVQNLSPSRIKKIERMFKPQVSAYTIPRRCGKSSFSSALMALSMVFCVGAGLRVLYTAQTKQLCTEAFNTLKSHVQKLVAFSNRQKHSEFIKKVEQIKKFNPNITKHGQTYYQTTCRWRETDQTVVITFYKFDRETPIIKQNTPYFSTNDFRAKPYICANAHRGPTYNFMFLDESNFVSPKIYPELLAQHANGSAVKMMCTSSQKNGQDSKAYVNISEIRMNKVVTNNVQFVCRNHCLALIQQNEVQYTMCLCNTFQQPHHINTGSEVTKLMKAFSVVNTGDEGGDVTTNRSAMLSEIGVIPPDLSKEDLHGLGDGISKMRLTVDCGRRNFMNNRVDVDYEISKDLCTGTVVAYLDPTPTSYKSENLETFDRSLHAMTFVTKLRDGRVVVLGMEEFTTQHYESETHDAMKAMATVFMAQVFSLNSLYEGHFNEFILVPEINSFDLDNMWYNCGLIYTKHQELLSHVCIMVPAIVVDQEQQKVFQSREKRKYKRVVLDNGRVILTDTGKQMEIDDGEGEYDIMEDSRAKSYVNDSLRALALTRDELQDRLHHDPQTKYKIGYRLGNDKVNIFLNFFSRTFYDKFYMAEVVVSMSNAGKNILDSHLLSALDSVVITTTVGRTTGRKVYHVSGKRSIGKNKHKADDLAVTTVMASELFDKYSRFRETESEVLLRLETIKEG
uniref:Putative DNA packaging terminase n=1 Tax=Abalone herpesvirus Taiwan/2005 TaxID=1821058 RepID=A0A143DI80_9VIRU|nr:putative DNA packaging terminase [Abalone herpesvirus Taiwan/2005]